MQALNELKASLNDLVSWSSDEGGNYKHESGRFFEIFGLRILNSATREVGLGGWDQPIISEVDFDGERLVVLDFAFFLLINMTHSLIFG